MKIETLLTLSDEEVILCARLANIMVQKMSDVCKSEPWTPKHLIEVLDEVYMTNVEEIAQSILAKRGAPKG